MAPTAGVELNSMGAENEPFLSTEKGYETPRPQVPQSPLQTWRKWTLFTLLQLFLLLIYTGATIWTIQEYKSRHHQAGYESPLHDLSLQYTQTTFHNLSRSPFAGSPSAQIDASWDELLAPMNIRVTKAELQRENLESIALKDSDGYLSWIGAFHQLHCINMLRKWNYQEYYHAGLTPEEHKHMASHADHCIEFLRQSTVCKPDTSLTTFKWDAHKTRPMFNASESTHTCVDWDVLLDSMASRQISEDEILSLRNPLMSIKKWE